MVKEPSMGLNVSGILQPFRLVEEIKGSRGRMLRIHLEPHSRHFYHRWFLCDVPDCSVEFFYPDSSFSAPILEGEATHRKQARDEVAGYQPGQEFAGRRAALRAIPSRSKVGSEAPHLSNSIQSNWSVR
jgi:hypothetical protein